MHFGAPMPPTRRFDSPDGQYGVCYLAATPFGAAAETLLRLAHAPTAHGDRLLMVRHVAIRAWATVTVATDLQLADLTGGAGLAPLGVTGALTIGDSHVAARELSAQLYTKHPRVDGIAYRARHDPDEVVFAVFERPAERLVISGDLVPLLSNLGLFEVIATRYGIALDDG
jgi:RES domain